MKLCFERMVVARLKQRLRFKKNSQCLFGSGGHFLDNGFVQECTKPLLTLQLSQLLQRIVEGYPGFVESSLAPVADTQVDARFGYFFRQI